MTSGMDEQQDYTTFAARVASFGTSIPNPTRKRPSNSKASRTISWPHEALAPAELARAGFYYKPSTESHDNATCFLCNRSLDGWEEEDDPVQEHIKHSPDCAWAILMNINQEQHDASTMEDPTHSSIADARRATFASGWPHESKRGWTCKTEKMVEAGWYFAPTPESEDFVSCAYCKLSLDGWEPKDNPFEEHYRRSPDCPFFAFAGTTAPPAKSKKGRTSKGSRQSTQAPKRIISQAQSIPDLDESIDTSTVSIMSTASVMGKKKTTRGGRKAAKDAEPEASLITETALELISLETAEPSASTKTTRGKKRKSDQISDDDQGRRESTVKPEPPAKRRNTRSRNSVARDVEDASTLLANEPQDIDVKPTKPARGGRKRGSSVSRRPSAASKADNKAILETSIPDNATIEAELEAELDRPLSDEEGVEKDVPKKPQKGRKKKAAEPREPEQDVASTMDEPIQDSQALLTEAEAEAKPKARKGRATKKAASKKSRAAKGSLESNATVETYQDRPNEGSVLTVHTVEDDSGHETDASVAGKSVARKASKKKATAKVAGKKTGKRVVSKKIEAIEEQQPQSMAALAAATEPEPSLAAAVEADKMEVDQRIAELTKEIDDEDAAAVKEPTKPAKGAKGKTAKPKTKKKDKVPQLSMPGAFSPLNMDSVEPSFASALETNTPPMRKDLRNHKAAREQEEDVEMEIRSPEQQSTPTPKRGAVPPALPPRSSARPTPTATSSAKKGTKTSAIPRPTPTKASAQDSKDHVAERSPSAQSSDAENAPPSSLPEDKRPPLQPVSPVQLKSRLAAAVSPGKKTVVLQPQQPGTPATTRRVGTVLLSPSKVGGGLTSEFPWSSVDVELVFQHVDPDGGKENLDLALGWQGEGLSSPEKRMSVEEWVRENARKAEEELKMEAERVVGVFEREGQRALRTLEGIYCDA